MLCFIFSGSSSGSFSYTDEERDSEERNFLYHEYLNNINNSKKTGSTSYYALQHDMEEESYDPYDDRGINNYYMDRYEDALLGDSEAIDEMRVELGDDWEGMY